MISKAIFRLLNSIFLAFSKNCIKFAVYWIFIIHINPYLENKMKTNLPKRESVYTVFYLFTIPKVLENKNSPPSNFSRRNNWFDSGFYLLIMFSCKIHHLAISLFFFHELYHRKRYSQLLRFRSLSFNYVLRTINLHKNPSFTLLEF